MRAVVFGGLAHALFFVAVSLVLGGIGVFRNRTAAPLGGDDFFTGALLALAAGALGTLGFALGTAPFPSWRRQRVRSAAVIGASMAVLTFSFQLTGFGFLPLRLILPSQILSAWPRTSGGVFLVFPGILAALLAAYVAWSRDPRRAAG
jgi:hypothetical protein